MYGAMRCPVPSKVMHMPAHTIQRPAHLCMKMSLMPLATLAFISQRLFFQADAHASADACSYDTHTHKPAYFCAKAVMRMPTDACPHGWCTHLMVLTSMHLLLLRRFLRGDTPAFSSIAACYCLPSVQVHDTHNIAFAARAWKVAATDLNQ
eukprot:scaffold269895_cov18-Tisochrysis_lutea.AAC.4